MKEERKEEGKEEKRMGTCAPFSVVERQVFHDNFLLIGKEQRMNHPDYH